MQQDLSSIEVLLVVLCCVLFIVSSTKISCLVGCRITSVSILGSVLFIVIFFSIAFFLLFYSLIKQMITINNNTTKTKTIPAYNSRVDSGLSVTTGTRFNIKDLPSATSFRKVLLYPYVVGTILKLLFVK